MEIKQAFQLEDGTAEFQAKLSEEEVSFLLEYAINILMQQGALPFMHIKDGQESKVSIQSVEEQ